jgi:putative ABC transport system permease protein
MRDSTTTAASLLPVTPGLGIMLAALLVAAVFVTARYHLGARTGPGRPRQIALAGLRAAIQLAAVSVVITYVIRSLWLLAAFLLVMVGTAVRTAGRRLTTDRSWWLASLPVAAGVVPVMAALLLTGLVPLKGITIVPVAGILLGGALTATVLAGRRALDELAQRTGEVEAAQALGFLARDARLMVVRPAASDAQLPGLDQTRTVGLVTLPGAFVGMLLGGATPIMAGAVQLFVLVALMAVQAAAVAVTIELVARDLLHRPPAP